MSLGTEIALIKALGGNGGGSGGGVLVVNGTKSGSTITLDKTWQEITDADVVVIVWEEFDLSVREFVASTNFDDKSESYEVTVLPNVTYTASSANGYPTRTV